MTWKKLTESFIKLKKLIRRKTEWTWEKIEKRKEETALLNNIHSFRLLFDIGESIKKILKKSEERRRLVIYLSFYVGHSNRCLLTRPKIKIELSHPPITPGPLKIIKPEPNFKHESVIELDNSIMDPLRVNIQGNIPLPQLFPQRIKDVAVSGHTFVLCYKKYSSQVRAIAYDQLTEPNEVSYLMFSHQIGFLNCDLTDVRVVQVWPKDSIISEADCTFIDVECDNILTVRVEAVLDTLGSFI